MVVEEGERTDEDEDEKREPLLVTTDAGFFDSDEEDVDDADCIVEFEVEVEDDIDDDVGIRALNPSTTPLLPFTSPLSTSML